MKIGIISLGLIGGSLFKVFINKGFDVCAVTRNKDTIAAAKKYTKNVSNDLNSLKNCNIVFVCSPMNKTPEILDALEIILNNNTIVTDVCSLKSFVMKKKRPYIFIGSHPMAGTENSGFEHSFKELFVGAKWVITPPDGIEKNKLQLLTKIIEETGANTLIANAEEHDKAVAMISHMPLILSQALVQATQSNKLALKLASSGFRDMTRLALSNTEMANDMYQLNNENIKESFENLKNNINNLMNSEYETSANDIKNIRKNLYNNEGKNIYN